ncbi:hypothetical protein DL765_006123 [Monosporascus sp. GIB2]|nr:hypothetical protein DL765_006123 [Monosporascus sp. GIB2]
MENTFERLSISDRKIIVAIDFGTTYSGMAWAETQRHDRRIAITTWPISQTIRDGKTSEKVPTKLRHTINDIQWGFQVPPQAPAEEVSEWFKLDLDPSLRPLTENKGTRRDAQKLVTDYLSKLGEHLLYTLRLKLGEALVRNTPLDFILTVPAIWSELAKSRTLEACQRAGGPFQNRPITLISEPEAAAIYTMHGLDPHGLEVGDSFVICDAGGGTVDLISYTITNLKPILEIREASPGSGALCGSSFLNRRFEAFLRSKLGNEEGFDDEILAEAMERFEEQTKRHFTMAALPNDTFRIPVPGLANNKALGIQRGSLLIKAQELQTIFEPVILQIIQLVRDQMTSSNIPIRAVLLVGGFGGSTYLRERLRNSLGPNVQVMQPPNAWLAVVNGAVMKGLSLSAPAQLTHVKLEQRVARRHYGTEFAVPYDPSKHSALQSVRRWDGLEGCYRVTVMNWFIKKGESVSENEAIYHGFRITTLVSSGRIQKLTLEIFVDGIDRPAILSRDGNLKVLCKVEADISHIPDSQLTQKRGVDGNMYYVVDAKLESVYHSASTSWTLIHKGQRYNTVKAEYV